MFATIFPSLRALLGRWGGILHYNRVLGLLGIAVARETLSTGLVLPHISHDRTRVPAAHLRWRTPGYSHALGKVWVTLWGQLCGIRDTQVTHLSTPCSQGSSRGWHPRQLERPSQSHPLAGTLVPTPALCVFIYFGFSECSNSILTFLMLENESPPGQIHPPALPSSLGSEAPSPADVPPVSHHAAKS